IASNHYNWPCPRSVGSRIAGHSDNDTEFLDLERHVFQLAQKIVRKIARRFVKLVNQHERYRGCLAIGKHLRRKILENLRRFFRMTSAERMAIKQLDLRARSAGA